MDSITEINQSNRENTDLKRENERLKSALEKVTQQAKANGIYKKAFKKDHQDVKSDEEALKKANEILNPPEPISTIEV